MESTGVDIKDEIYDRDPPEHLDDLIDIAVLLEVMSSGSGSVFQAKGRTFRFSFCFPGT